MNVLDQKTIKAVAIAGVLLGSPAAAEEPHQYIAHAYAMSTGEVLYTEHHSELWSEGLLIGGRVEYRDSAGKTFARKVLSFDRSLFAPSFRMVDTRDGFEERADWSESGLRLFAARDGEEKARVIQEPPEGAVIDAGFQRYMQDRLPLLLAGQPDEFSFAVPSFGRFVRFRVEQVGVPGGQQVRLRMKPANALLRFLVDPIELLYDRDGRLLEFEGVTNIPDDAGERHLARTVFQYPESTVENDQVASAG